MISKKQILEQVEKQKLDQLPKNLIDQEVTQFGEFTPDSVTIDQLGANNKKAIKLMRMAGWD